MELRDLLKPALAPRFKQSLADLCRRLEYTKRDARFCAVPMPVKAYTCGLAYACLGPELGTAWSPDRTSWVLAHQLRDSCRVLPEFGDYTPAPAIWMHQPSFKRSVEAFLDREAFGYDDQHTCGETRDAGEIFYQDACDFHTFSPWGDRLAEEDWDSYHLLHSLVFLAAERAWPRISSGWTWEPCEACGFRHDRYSCCHNTAQAAATLFNSAPRFSYPRIGDRLTGPLQIRASTRAVHLPQSVLEAHGLTDGDYVVFKRGEGAPTIHPVTFHTRST